MGLTAGTPLGTYEIVVLLGAGGMGEVYRARDRRLDRDVAIKVLPESLANDPQRVARFEREARLLASLNHPNIAVVHGFEEADGRHYLVLEHVDGETLAQRRGSGRLPLEDVLDVCRQIAEALEAAHDKGVVHRDLKPGNVMIRPDGTVKVLDFGLARIVSGDHKSTSAGSDAATLSVQSTTPGVVLGTVPYMSPEQARGKPLDKRSDIWALGCVLFECLCGRTPFEAETTTDVLARIVTEDPDLTALREIAPPFLYRLVGRCLEKDPRRRLRDAGEVRVAIEAFQADPQSEIVAEPAQVSPQRRPVAALVPWMVAVFLGAAWLSSLWPGAAGPPLAAPATSRWTIPLPDGERVGWQDTRSGWGKIASGRLVAISQDGADVAFAAQNEDDQARLYLRDTNGFKSHPLPGTANARSPFFSPDGRWLAFAADTKLQKVSLGGGSPLEICDVRSISFDGTWSADGRHIVFGTDTGLWRVSAAGGAPERLTTPRVEDGEVGHHFPQFTPDGAHVLFTVSATPQTHVALLSLKTGAWDILVRDGAQPRVLRSGHLLFARGRDLLAAPYDPGAAQPVGEAVPVLSKLDTLPGLGGVVVAQFDVSDTGTLVFVPYAGEPTDDQLLWVDDNGRETLITSGPGRWMHPRLSPDGRRVSLDIHSADGMKDIYIWELDAGHFRRLTHQGIAFESEWRPDGRRMAICSGELGGRSIYWIPTDFSRPMELLIKGKHSIPNSWSPDGETLVYYEHAEGGIWALPLDGDRSPKRLVSTAQNERFPRLSPDGKWMAFVADELGRREVFVQALPGLGSRHRISVDGGGEPVWSRDGKRLFFRQDDRVLAVDIEYEPNFKAGPPSVLFEGTYDAAHIGHQHFDVSLDGTKFLMIKHGRRAAPGQVRVILNWFAELRNRVPGIAAER